MNTDARFEAIKELYPQTGSVQDGLYAFDPNGNPIDIDESKIKPVYEKKLAEYNSKKYQHDRLQKYPNTNDLIVALWEKVVEGRDESSDALEVKRQEVKTAHPKPG